MDHYSGVGETPRQNAYRNIQGASRDASPVHGGRDGPDKSVRYTRKFSFRSPIHIQTGYPFRIEHPGEFRSIHFRYTSSLTRGHKTTVIHLYHSRRSIFLIISSTSADADVSGGAFSRLFRYFQHIRDGALEGSLRQSSHGHLRLTFHRAEKN